jgi:tRNA(Ile)-lysidine synthetase-like protein
MPGDASSRTAPALDPAVGRQPLVGAVHDCLHARCGVRPGDRVIAGCSGGADSVALVLCLAVIGRRGDPDRPPVRPIVAHVNHGLRAGAPDDEAFVKTLAERLSLPYRSLGLGAERPRENVQAWARRRRYGVLADAARDAGADHIAVAHHAEDQLETMLMALGRGTGLDGLAGMSWRGPVPSGAVGSGTGLHLIRPLLDRHRRECEDLCRAAGLEWREDPGNADLDRTRARIRAQVLPVLESLWPGAAARAAGTAAQLAALRPLLDRELDGAFGPAATTRWSRDALRDLPAPLIAAGLHRATAHRLGRASDVLGQRRLTAAAEMIASDERAPKSFEWPRGMTLEVTAHSVALSGTNDE